MSIIIRLVVEHDPGGGGWASVGGRVMHLPEWLGGGGEGACVRPEFTVVTESYNLLLFMMLNFSTQTLKFYNYDINIIIIKFYARLL